MPSQERIVPMRVLVLGVHRTGTLSVRHALRQLGIHDCYHMHSVTEDRSQAKLWVRAIETKFGSSSSSTSTTPFTRQDWDEILHSCQAISDLPAVLFGPELAKAYPEAKVIILNRDPEAWHDSIKATFGAMRPRGVMSVFTILRMLFCALLDPNTRDFARMTRGISTKAMGFDQVQDREEAIAWFGKQYDEYRASVEPERRIEYSVKDGWGPLCAHLGVEVPMVRDEKGNLVEAPFPRVNDRDEFLAKYRSMGRASIKAATDNVLRGLGKIVLFASVAYGGYVLSRKL